MHPQSKHPTSQRKSSLKNHLHSLRSLQHLLHLKNISFLLKIFFILHSTFFISCKTSTSLSSRNAISQTQWRSALDTQSASLWRLTALSIDSITLHFDPPTRSVAGQATQPNATSPLKAAKRPTSIHLYGLSTSRTESAQSVRHIERTDSSAMAQHSATDMSQTTTKALPSLSLWLTLIPIAIMTTAILYLSVKLKR